MKVWIEVLHSPTRCTSISLELSLEILDKHYVAKPGAFLRSLYIGDGQSLKHNEIVYIHAGYLYRHSTQLFICTDK